MGNALCFTRRRTPPRGRAYFHQRLGEVRREGQNCETKSLEAGARKSPNVPNYVKHYNHGYSTVIKTRKRHFTGALYPGSGDRPRRGFLNKARSAVSPRLALPTNNLYRPKENSFKLSDTPSGGRAGITIRYYQFTSPYSLRREALFKPRCGFVFRKNVQFIFLTRCATALLLLSSPQHRSVAPDDIMSVLFGQTVFVF